MLSVQIRIHLGGNDRASRTHMRITYPDGQWREYCLAEGDDTKLLLLDERSRQARTALCHIDIGGPVQSLSMAQYHRLMAAICRTG